MKKIYGKDLRRFTRLFAFSALGILFLYQLVDFLSKMPDFFKEKSPAGFILLYYFLSTFPLLVRTYPLVLLLALSLFLGEIGERKEILLLESSGISPRRWFFPQFLFLFFLTLFIYVLHLTGSPFIQMEGYRIWKGKIQGNQRIWNMVEDKIGWEGGKNRVIFINRLKAGEGRIEGMDVILPQKKERWKVEKGIWTNKGWILQNLVIRSMEKENEKRVKEMRVNFIPPPLTLWKSNKPLELLNWQELRMRRDRLSRVEMLDRTYFIWFGFLLTLTSFGFLYGYRVSRSFLLLKTFSLGLVFYLLYYFMKSWADKVWFSPLFLYLGFLILQIFILILSMKRI